MFDFCAEKRSTIGETMKQTKLLLITFFLTLIIFQRAPASARPMSIAPDLAPASKLQSYSPPEQIYVRMYHLDTTTHARLDEPGIGYVECDPLRLDTAYGCTEAAGNDAYHYPYTTNPALVNVEDDYLLDVIAREMPPQLYPNPLALSAQAVASRSFAYYWNNNNYYLWNSNDFQVFVPYAFEYFLSDTKLKDEVRTAVTSTAGVYVAPNGSDQPALTQFRVGESYCRRGSILFKTSK